jgi:glyoxylase-like metal-dependent hydrolase (beta-lactamase superfamily II)
MIVNRQPLLSRRGLLHGAAALGAAGYMAGAFQPTAAFAKAPMASAQAPYWYRFKVGALEVTMVSDGILPLGEPSGSFLGVTKDEVGKMLTDNFLPADNVVLEQNIPVVNTGNQLVMFDSGMGTSKMFGPTTGRLLKSLAEAGIDPANIDAFVASHAHIDHVGGLVGADGKPLFPNAKVYLSQLDFDYWTDESNQKANKDFVAHARKNLLPYRDRIVFYKNDEEFLPGIQAMHAPGHTVGHTIFMLTSEGKSMAYIGDLTHHQVILMERPRIQFAYDTDPAQSAETRVRNLDMLAAQKIPLIAYHFPWPGIGHVAKQGDGFRFFASPMNMNL